jgi:hypothetical protein
MGKERTKAIEPSDPALPANGCDPTLPEQGKQRMFREAPRRPDLMRF